MYIRNLRVTEPWQITYVNNQYQTKTAALQFRIQNSLKSSEKVEEKGAEATRHFF